MAQGPEGKLQQRIRKALTMRFPSSYFVKNHGSLYSGKGRPDIEGCYKGRFYAFEVKVPGKEKNLTAIQANTLNKIQSAGGTAELVTSPQQAIKLVELTEKKRYRANPYRKIRGIWRRSKSLEDS